MLHINTNGVTRIVFVFNTFVVKFPKFYCKWEHFLRGLLANINENNTWKWNSGEYENGKSYCLCPVLWCSWGGWFLIMKRAETFSYSQWQNMGELYIEEHKKFFPGDDTISNYGMLDGVIVKIDYGELDIPPTAYKVIAEVPHTNSNY